MVVVEPVPEIRPPIMVRIMLIDVETPAINATTVSRLCTPIANCVLLFALTIILNSLLPKHIFANRVILSYVLYRIVTDTVLICRFAVNDKAIGSRFFINTFFAL